MLPVHVSTHLHDSRYISPSLETAYTLQGNLSSQNDLNKQPVTGH